MAYLVTIVIKSRSIRPALSVCLSVYRSIRPSIDPSMFVWLPNYQSVHPCLDAYLCVYLLVCLSSIHVCQSVWPPAHLSAYLFISVSLFMSIYLSVRSSILDCQCHKFPHTDPLCRMPPPQTRRSEKVTQS